MPYNSVWPDLKLLNKLPPSKRVKLKAITYTQYLNCLFLNGIQLELTCKASKMVRADFNSKNLPTKKIEIVNASDIREVHVKVDSRQG